MATKNMENSVTRLPIDRPAWPGDVIADLIDYLRGADFPETAEHLSDALIVFEAECRGRAIKPPRYSS